MDMSSSVLMVAGVVGLVGACGDTRHPSPQPPPVAQPTPPPKAAPNPAAASPKPKAPPPKCAYDPPGAPALAKIEGSSIALGEKVLFETGSAKIDARSDALLRSVATVMIQHPDLEFVEVAGHADARGGDAKNKKLTTDRAKAVMDRLIALNVSDTRLRSVGYSHDCPVDPAETDAAYEKNRRVELVILRRGGEETGVAWGGCDAAKNKGMKPQPIPATAPNYAEAKGSEQSCEPPLIADAKRMTQKVDHVLNGKEFFGQTCLGVCADFPKQVELITPKRADTPWLCKALRKKDPRDVESRLLDLSDNLYRRASYSPLGSAERLALKRRALSSYQATFGVSSEQKRQLVRGRMGDLYRWSGMFDEAIAEYRAIIEADCKPGEAKVGHIMVALSLYQSGPKDAAKLDAASKELDAAEATQAEGSNILIAILRAKILDSRGKRDEAKAMLKKVVEHNKSQYAKMKFDWHWTDFHIPDWAR